MSTYGLLIYLMTEKEEAERIKKWLSEKEIEGPERKKLEELAEWHIQNCTEGLKQPEWIPGCVKDFILGYRKERPSWKEIQQEYVARQKYLKRNEKLYRKIAFSFALGAALFLIFKLR